MTSSVFDRSTSTLSPSSTLTAPLVEVFSAIQGEGLNVGTRQIFIRFGGCDLRCQFCDSAHTWHASQTCRIESVPGQREFVQHPNPVSVEQLLGWVQQQNRVGLHDSISLTGGEPLLHPAFLHALLPRLSHDIRLPIYLETGGHRPEDLQPLLPHLDIVGMDLKLPSVSGEDHWSAHAAFLQACHQAHVTVFCKVIIAQQTSQEDLEQVGQLVAQVNDAIPVFLQPVTPLGPNSKLQPPTPAQVLTWQAQLKEKLQSVRVIPQTHKLLDQL